MMLSSVRRVPAAVRSFRFASLASSTLQSSRSIRVRCAFPQARTSVLASRPFSSISRHLQEAAAIQESSVEGQQEYSQFQELAEHGIISPAVIRNITSQDIHTMTEVQQMTLNSCLDGSDIIAQAKTGTGKTLAFLLPIVQNLLKDPSLQYRSRGRRGNVDIRALIVSPTRELAEQIAVEASRLVRGTGITVQTAVGGTQKNFHLRKMQNEGCNLLIGTPGRINDLLSDSRSGVSMDNISTFVLDEADRLLDIGFAPAIEEIQSYMPDRADHPRQTMMFSATVPKSVVSLVRQTMRPDFKFVRTVDPNEAPTHERIPQNVVFMDGLQNQMPTILEIATKAIKAHQDDPENVLPFKAIVYFGATTQVDMAYEVFSNLRSPGNELSRDRLANPLYPTKILRINGQLTQRERSTETQAFREAESAILFSTDVTARGMDFPNVSHVIQTGLPRNSDDYIHRLGRTGRAGKSGEGWLLLNADEQRDFSRAFQHKGIEMKNISLETASLDMSRPAQLSADVAKILQAIEVGVKSVSIRTKSAVYTSLLGVMQQQFPGRDKQTQIDMMNDLARYGWGMQTPPTLSQMLVRKLGYDRCEGINYGRDEDRGSRRSGMSDRRGNDRGRGRRDDNNDPFGMGFGGGKGTFSASNSRPDGDRRGGSFGGSRSSGSFGRRDGFDRRR